MVGERPPPSSTSVGDLDFSPRRLGRLSSAADTRCVVRQRFPPEGVLKPPQQDRLRESGTSWNQFTGTRPLVLRLASRPASGHVSVSGAARVRHGGPFTDGGGDGSVSGPRCGARRQDRGETANQHSSWTGDHSRRNSRTFIVTSARFACSVRGGRLQ